ncbi:MaoC family dehydratase N-terminal domain-containing protein [Alcanivorax sp. JB21]|uniref:FAS1-like dehydratase domain-containing protein n=1 Tax=Alcanivorax limicola TaxID=2874102 RepID=UPI001CC04AE5|nr:MaoC family dehydratase N-terminal domain-containing protein [Alcanivorax limicola]MBZ2187536.1 MaoC family dehydratase N-terminal domain-containing protein [Alcanivorax limicola]
MAAAHDGIGREEHCADALDATLAARVAATFGQPAPAVGAALPWLWHWAFFQTPVPAAGIGPDGHPARGTFLPPAENRHRMWAGSQLHFHAPLRVGLPAERRTRIAAIEEKQGRSGALLFVTLQHRYTQHGTLAIEEQQDIVYRAPTAPRAGEPAPLADCDWYDAITPDPVLLFRYAAVTFNAHRIHYDLPYTTGAEGYPGLVVQGPLMATLMMQAFTRAHPGATPTHMQFRGVRPMIAPTPFRAGGRLRAPGEADIFIDNADGLAQTGLLRFTE